VLLQRRSSLEEVMLTQSLQLCSCRVHNVADRIQSSRHLRTARGISGQVVGREQRVEGTGEEARVSACEQFARLNNARETATRLRNCANCSTLRWCASRMRVSSVGTSAGTAGVRPSSVPLGTDTFIPCSMRKL
jgi:hypothetical protein